MPTTGRRPWIVRMLINLGTGLAVAFATLLVGSATYAAAYGLFAGPSWLRLLIGIPILLTILTVIGSTFHRKGY